MPDRMYKQNMEQLDCHQNATEPQATEYHTCVHWNFESGLAYIMDVIIKHAAHRLVQHTLQVVEDSIDR